MVDGEEQLWRDILVKLARIEEQTKGLDELTRDVWTDVNKVDTKIDTI